MHHTGVAFYQQGQILVADLGHVNRLQARAEQAEAGKPGQGALAAGLQRLLDLEGGFMDVHVDRRVQLFGDDADLFQVVVAHRVRRMRAQGHGDARVVAQVTE
ncbi:hypothetical protein D9M71_305940 [compost metagenome]